MDNQLALKLAWLGGVMDADGCYCAPVQRTKRMRKVYPEAKIANTNTMVIAKVVEILAEIGVHFTVEVRKAKRSHKELTTIRVKRLKELGKFLSIIEEYSIGKKPQVQVLGSFLKSREMRTSLEYNARYTEQERAFLEEVHILNQNGRREKRGVNDCMASVCNHEHT